MWRKISMHMIVGLSLYQRCGGHLLSNGLRIFDYVFVLAGSPSQLSSRLGYPQGIYMLDVPMNKTGTLKILSD